MSITRVLLACVVASCASARSSWPADSPSAMNWAVVTSIRGPTAALRTLNALPGWRTVVVGDEKSPPAAVWSNLSHVVYLDLEDQNALGYRILQYLPRNHYARKVCNWLLVRQLAPPVSMTAGPTIAERRVLIRNPPRRTNHIRHWYAGDCGLCACVTPCPCRRRQHSGRAHVAAAHDSGRVCTQRGLGSG